MTSRSLRCLLLCCALLTLATVLLGQPITLWAQTTMYVNAATGNDANTGLSPAQAKLTIQNAITSLPAAGGIVQVAPGTYVEQVTINKRVQLNGTDSSNTIIQLPTIGCGTGNASTCQAISFVAGADSSAMRDVKLLFDGEKARVGLGIAANVRGIILERITYQCTKFAQYGGSNTITNRINIVEIQGNATYIIRKSRFLGKYSRAIATNGASGVQGSVIGGPAVADSNLFFADIPDPANLTYLGATHCIRFGGDGTTLIQNNHFSGAVNYAGVEIAGYKTNAQNLIIRDNRFTCPNDVTGGQLVVNLVNSSSGNVPVLIENNSFEQLVGQYQHIGLRIAGSHNVTAINNRFSAVTSDFIYLFIDNTFRGSIFLPGRTSVTAYGNTFNGFTTAGGTGIFVRRTTTNNPLRDYLALSFDGPVANNFSTQLGRFIEIEDSLGAVVKLVKANLTTFPTTLTNYEIEDRMVHRVDDATGQKKRPLLEYVPKSIFVTNTNLTNPVQDNRSIQDAVDALEVVGPVTDDWTIFVRNTGTTYGQPLTFNYACKFAPDPGTDLAGALTVELQNDTKKVVLLSNFDYFTSQFWVKRGDFDLNGNIIVFNGAANLREEPGQTITGATGYIQNTRSIFNATNLNVSGFGLSLTFSGNLGSTIVRRGHTPQTGTGFGSIARYYEIIPTSVPAATASLTFRYDSTELNGETASLLKLYKSLNSGVSYTQNGGTHTPYQVVATGQTFAPNTRWTLSDGFNVPEVYIVSGDTALCAGDSVVLSLRPTAFTSVNWSNGATTDTIVVKQAGNYTVTAVSNGTPVAAPNSITVTLLPLPNPVVTPQGSTAVCFGDSLRLTVSGGPYAVYQWSTGATTPEIFVKQAGNYTVAVVDNNGCSATSPAVVVTFQPNKPLLTAGGPTRFCADDSLLLTAPSGFAAYLWSNGASGQSLTVKNSGLFWVRVTDGSGCSRLSDTVSVQVDTLPTPTLSASGPLTFCQGDSVILRATPGFATYLWSNGATSQNITVKATGSYSATVTNANGCQGVSAATTVTVNPLPTVAIAAGGPTTFCQGGSVTLTATAGLSNYAWSSGQTTQAITVTTPGTYTVSAQNPTTGCRATSAPVIVTVNALPAPTLQASGPLSFCAGGSVTFSVPGTFANYLWSNGATTPTITVSASGAYQVQVTDANGCVGSSNTLNVVSNSLPTPIIVNQTGNNTLCPGDSAILVAPTGFVLYRWNTGETTRQIVVKQGNTYAVEVFDAQGCRGVSNSITIQGPTPQPTLSQSGLLRLCPNQNTVVSFAGTFPSIEWFRNGVSFATNVNSITIDSLGLYYAQVTDNLGCTQNSDSLTVEQFFPPTLTPAGPITICFGDSVILDATNAYAGYTWSNGATTPQLAVKQSGLYYVTVQGFGNFTACTGNSDTVEVIVRPKAFLEVTTATGDSIFCLGSSLQLRATPGFISYVWNDSTTTDSLIAFTPGIYWVEATDTNGCRVRDSITVTERQLPIVTIPPTATPCDGTPIQLDAGAGFVSYLWSTGDTTQTITVFTGGIYSVSVVDSFGCANTASSNVTYLPSPVVSLPTVAAYCPGNFLVLDAGNFGADYQWNDGSNLRTLLVTQPGNYSVQVTLPNGCSRVMTTVVNAGTAPVVNAGPDRTICGQPIVLDAGVGFDSYTWSTGSTAQVITVNQPGFYIVEVRSANGCYDKDTVRVTAEPALVEPFATATQTLCAGTGLVLDALNPGATYLWSDSTTGQTLAAQDPGLYWVEIQSPAGCTLRDSVVIVPDGGANIVYSLPDTVQAGVPFSVSASGGNSYAWTFNGPANPATTSGPNPTGLRLLGSGYQQVVLQVRIGSCNYIFTDSIFVFNPNSVKNNLAAFQWGVYPNPASHMATLWLEGKATGNFRILLVDITGKTFDMGSTLATGTESHSYPLDLSGFAAGLYSVRLISNGWEETTKLMIAK